MVKTTPKTDQGAKMMSSKYSDREEIPVVHIPGSGACQPSRLAWS